MHIFNQQLRARNGFTIIELIVVVSIVAILATISIVGYGSWRNAAISAQIKSDLSAVAAAMENSRTFNNGYPLILPTTVTASQNITLTLTIGSTATAYCINGVSSESASLLFYVASETKEQGPLTGTCATRPPVNIPLIPAGLASTGITTSSFGLTWLSSTHATRYITECATDQAFVVNLRRQTVTTATSSSITGLSSSTEYFCRVQAGNSLGASAWTAALRVTTVTPPASYVAVRATDNNAYAIRTNGSLWAWGSGGTSGQVGNNSTANQLTPVQILTSVASVSARGASTYAMALRTNGSLWAWGSGTSGQLGKGDTTNQLTPIQVLTSVASVTSGEVLVGNTTYAIRTDGSLWAWGEGTSGQVGNGSINDQFTPTQIMTNVVSVHAAGGNTTFAIRTDGTLWAWGSGTSGQVGNGGTTAQLTPVQVLTGVASVNVTSNNAYALRTDGTVWAWGIGSFGRVGNNSTANQLTPVQVLTSAASVIGRISGEAFAIRTDGTLWAWGVGALGRLGNNSTTDQLTPVQVLTNVASITSIGASTHAIRTDGTLWAWGAGSYGRIGNNSIANQLTPVQVLTTVSSVNATQFNAYAIRTDGSLWAWGFGSQGRVGNNSTVDQLTPVFLP